ncbi:hypothetical protein KIW84_053881 [Lathyrus oleraceus]|uniref:Uncharacterized protein n=1 Tax=Pisum sativum TaxID=3888 RepID=A0A9D5AHE2_PEA|nr:hypothetical protein KIW84_053881 [Pisum sativum]
MLLQRINSSIMHNLDQEPLSLNGDMSLKGAYIFKTPSVFQSLAKSVWTNDIPPSKSLATWKLVMDKMTTGEKILKVFNIRVNPHNAPQILEFFWHPPHLRCVKCNCDGAFTMNINKIDCGGIFRGNHGNFRLAFAISVQCPSSTLAEFEIVILAMEITIQRG